jgi:hypothetical protein
MENQRKETKWLAHMDPHRIVVSIAVGGMLKGNNLLLRIGSNFGQGLYVSWVESATGPTYFPAIFVLLAKSNKIVEVRTIRL